MHRHTLFCLAASLCLGAAAHAAQPQDGASAEPEISSYSIDTTLKLSSDRKSRGVSDTFGRPGVDLTVEAAHESGLVGQFQLGTVSRFNYPDSNRLNPLLALGWRGGDPDGLHYGVGAAREWFLRAKVNGAPTGFDAEFNPTGVADTRFHTSYLLGELGWGIFTARYLHVVSKDFRGANTSTICASYLPAMMAGGDPTAAMDCYGRGMQHSRGTQLLDLDMAYPINGTTKLIGHLGWQRVRHFSQMNTVDYRLGLEHTRWGFVWGAEVAGARAKNRDMFIAADDGGKIRRMDGTKLILSVAKRF